MTPLAWPTGRTLDSWWQQLPPSPRRLWLAQLLVHRVEAQVSVARHTVVSATDAALLHALSGSAPPRDGLGSAAAVLAPWLVPLRIAGLVTAQQGVWTLSPAGRLAMERGSYEVVEPERRVFYFVDNSAVGRPPHFLPLRRGSDSPARSAVTFDPAVLNGCVKEDAGWKERFGFPADVRSAAASHAAPDWRQVIFVRTEQTALLFAEMPDGLVGYLVRPEVWVLEVHNPVLQLAGGWEEALPELAEPNEEVWRSGWLEWCQRQGIAADDASACQVRREGVRLIVTAPQPIAARLPEQPSDRWLLAGQGRTRETVRIEVVGPTSS